MHSENHESSAGVGLPASAPVAFSAPVAVPVSDALLRNLPRRAALLRALRGFFDAAGFVEVETPVRIPAPANEPHILPPPSGRAFLRSSPELQMKRLLAAGMERIWQIGPCFRQGERGDRHAPEFTMLEWYRAPGNAAMILDDLLAMLPAAARAVCGTERIRFRGAAVDLAAPAEVLPVREAYRRFAGWDPVEAWDSDRFDVDMALRIEPALPRDRVCVLVEYPAPAAALARLLESDPRVSERWEAYAGGMELANAFGELCDAVEQRRRFEAARDEKIACGEPPMPLDEEFLADLPSMPPAGGAALGVDRLAMLLADAESIDDVRPFLPPVGALW